MFSYNPKIDFKFCLNLWQKRDLFESEMVSKPVFYGKNNPSTLTDVMMMRAKEILIFLKNIDKITTDELNHILKILNVDNDYNNDKFIDILPTLNDGNFSVETLTNIFYELYTNVFYGNFKIELTKIMVSFYAIKGKGYPIIFFPLDTSILIEMLKNYDLNKERLITEFDKIIKFTETYNSRSKNLPLNDIKAIIVNNRHNIMHSFNIKHLYIFGSYSRREETEYSDIDFAVMPLNNDVKFDVLKRGLFEYLQNLFQNKIDISLINDCRRLNEPMYKGAIRIF